MTSIERWNKIVDIFNRNKNSREQNVQIAWENIFSELFDYSRLDGDIDSQRPVKMGVSTKYPDIILRHNNEDLFVVELKRPVLHEGRDQLFSYLAQLKINIGVLICDNMYVYDFDYSGKENKHSVVEINFLNDNPLGIHFLDLFNKASFDKEKIKSFIAEYSEKKDAVKLIQDNITPELLRKLVQKHFETDFDAETVELAVSDYEFKCLPKELHDGTPVQQNYPSLQSISTQNYNNSLAPEVVLMIGDRAVSPREFKDRLLIKKIAKRFWYYKDKTAPEQDDWDASKFRSDSNLLGNIHSTKYRHWKTSGLIKLVCVIDE